MQDHFKIQCCTVRKFINTKESKKNLECENNHAHSQILIVYHQVKTMHNRLFIQIKTVQEKRMHA